MTGRAIRIGVATAAVLLLTLGLAVAKTKNVNIDQRSKLASGTILEAGTYKVEILEQTSKPEAAFYRGNKLVARAPVKLEAQPKKAPYTMIYFVNSENPPKITGIKLKGSSEMIVFSGKVEATPSGM